MQLFYFKAPSGNFGDDLNLWFWDHFLPGWREAKTDTTLIGVGTLINNQLPRGIPKLILGSGVGYGPLPDAELLAECRILSVRGPRSAKALGLQGDQAIVDPAVMLPEHPVFASIAKDGPPIFIPHVETSDRQDWVQLCRRAGVEYVSPSQDAQDVIRRIAAAPLVIAESMHAAIIADSFRTPWHAVAIGHKFNRFKWQDWADSIDVELKIIPLYPSIDWLAKTIKVTKKVPAQTALSARANQGSMKISRSTHLRRGLERLLTPQMLGRLAESPGNLSDRDLIEKARDRYRLVLKQVRAEFG